MATSWKSFRELTLDCAGTGIDSQENVLSSLKIASGAPTTDDTAGIYIDSDKTNPSNLSAEGIYIKIS